MTGSETVDCVRSLPYLQEHRKAISRSRRARANASSVSHSSTYRNSVGTVRFMSRKTARLLCKICCVKAPRDTVQIGRQVPTYCLLVQGRRIFGWATWRPIPHDSHNLRQNITHTAWLYFTVFKTRS
jgi:hypothetical protein